MSETLQNLSATDIAIAAGAVVAAAGYFTFVLAPSWSSYGRMWERVAAGFLSLYIFAALLGVGTAIGLTLVYYYDRLLG